MRLAWKRENSFSPVFSSYPTLAREFPKKIKKTSFRHYFYPNRDEIGRQREKKNLVPNSVPTRPGLENFKKKIVIKFKKLENFIPELFLFKPG